MASAEHPSRGPLCGGGFAFDHKNDAVDAREGDFFAEAARPEDFEFVDFRGGAEAEMEAGVGGRGVAGAARDVGALADAADGKEYFGADGVTGGTMRWRVRQRRARAAVGDRYRRSRGLGRGHSSLRRQAEARPYN